MSTAAPTVHSVAAPDLRIGPAGWDGRTLVAEAAAGENGSIYRLGPLETLVLDALRRPGTAEQVQDRVQVLGPLLQAAAGHEVVGAGAHEEQVGAVDLGQEAVAHTSHGGTQLGVRDPFDVASSAGGDNAGDTRHKGLLLSLDTRAGDERIPHSSQPQRRTTAAGNPGVGGGMRSVRRDNALALSRRLRGEAHSTTGDGSLGNGQGAAQCPADTASGCGEGTHVARVYGRPLSTICGIAHTDEGEQSPADASSPRRHESLLTLASPY